jgi:hypothetical protein
MNWFNKVPKDVFLGVFGQKRVENRFLGKKTNNHVFSTTLVAKF